MRIVPVGIGESGLHAVDEFIAFEEATGLEFIETPVGITTDSIDEEPLAHLSELELIELNSILEPAFVDTGVDASVSTQPEALDRNLEFDHSDPIHAFVIVGDLLDGLTGTVLVEIAEYLIEDRIELVFGVPVIPTDFNSPDTARAARRHFEQLGDTADQLIVFDHANTALGYGAADPLREFTRRLSMVLTADDTPADFSDSFPHVDTQDIAEVLAGPGIASLGYAATQTDAESTGFVSRLTGGKEVSDALTRNESQLIDLLRRAVTDGSSLSVDPQSAAKSMLLLGGPQEVLETLGPEQLMQWLAHLTGTSPRTGVYPFRESGSVAMIVLLAGIEPEVAIGHRFGQVPFKGAGENGNLTEGSTDDGTTTVKSKTLEQPVHPDEAVSAYSEALTDAETRLARAFDGARLVSSARAPFEEAATDIQEVPRRREEIVTVKDRATRVRLAVDVLKTRINESHHPDEEFHDGIEMLGGARDRIERARNHAEER